MNIDQLRPVKLLRLSTIPSNLSAKTDALVNVNRIERVVEAAPGWKPCCIVYLVEVERAFQFDGSLDEFITAFNEASK